MTSLNIKMKILILCGTKPMARWVARIGGSLPRLHEEYAGFFEANIALNSSWFGIGGKLVWQISYPPNRISPLITLLATKCGRWPLWFGSTYGLRFFNFCCSGWCRRVGSARTLWNLGPVPPIEGTFVLNVADILSIWTGGLFVSTPNRVKNTSGRER